MTTATATIIATAINDAALELNSRDLVEQLATLRDTLDPIDSEVPPESIAAAVIVDTLITNVLGVIALDMSTVNAVPAVSNRLRQLAGLVYAGRM